MLVVVVVPEGGEAGGKGGGWGREVLKGFLTVMVMSRGAEEGVGGEPVGRPHGGGRRVPVVAGEGFVRELLMLRLGLGLGRVS